MTDKQSNVYTIIYITVMAIVVGAVLVFISSVLKERQNENVQADKKSQILQAVHLSTTRNTVIADFDKYIVGQVVVNDKGQEIEGIEAFNIDVAAEAKKPAAERLLPVYICQLPEDGIKYILPLAGMGLWGPIWGYVSFDADGSTIYGAFFDHQGETPGLGAEITKPAFTGQFPGRVVFKGDNFYPIEVVKAGQKPMNPEVDYVDGISGGTITSKGVGAMFDNCLSPYRAWLEQIRGANPTQKHPMEVIRISDDNQPTAEGQTDISNPSTSSGIKIASTVEKIEKARADADAKAETTLAKKVTQTLEPAGENPE